MALQLTGEQIKTITQSSYYHLKHYHELGEDNAGKWLGEINGVYSKATSYLDGIIATQEAREQGILNQVFQGQCTVQSLIKAGFTAQSANVFYNAFQKGKAAGSIAEQVQALNEILNIRLTTASNSSSNALAKAAVIINQAFAGASASGQTFEDMDEYFTFISGLYAVNQRLLEYANQQKNELKQALLAAVRKLDGAISFYKSDYLQKNAERQQAITQLQGMFAAMDQFISANGAKTWSGHKADRKTFDNVQAVLNFSASGFLRQSQGGDYEAAAAKELLEGIYEAFSATNVQIASGTATIVGRQTDSLKKQQKADIMLTFQLTATTQQQQEVTITFSVKKKQSGSSLQVHHGGSMFAYANRFQAVGGRVGEDFEFLNDGNFQYVYVNELREGGQSGQFLSAFRRMLEGVGYLFLGEQVQNMAGADFLFVQGRIYSFSEILRKIKLDPAAFTVTVGRSKRDPISQKSSLVSSKYADAQEYYSDDFIADSIAVGRDAIYGTTFSINLKTSYLK